MTRGERGWRATAKSSGLTPLQIATGLALASAGLSFLVGGPPLWTLGTAGVGLVCGLALVVRAARRRGGTIRPWCVGVGLGVLLVVPAGAQETRVDLFDRRSNRTGSATVDEKSGRVDFYDKSSRRTGYGTLDQKSGRIDFYDSKSRRTGSGQITTPRGGRR